MRTKLLPFLLLFLCIQLKAENNDTKLVVWKSDGTSETILLEEKPITTFTQEELTINTNIQSVTYPLKSVVKYTYVGLTNGIGTVSGDNNINISFSDNNLIIENQKTGTPVEVYSATGLLLSSSVVCDSRYTVISLSDKVNGVYIVKVGDTTHKLLKK